MPFFTLLRRFGLSSLCLLTALGSIARASAQQSPEPWKSPRFSLSPKDLFEAASAVSAPEGANVVVLEADIGFSFDQQGRLVHSGYYVYKILTQKGAEGWDSLSVGWEPWHEARPEIRVRVITPDFAEHALDPKTITEAPARGGDYKIYSDDKRLHAPFPAIAPGVVVEEEFVGRETEPLFAAGRNGLVTFGWERIPVAHSQFELSAPSALPLRTGQMLLPDLKPERTEADGRITLTYRMGRIEGAEPWEPNLPPDAVRYPEVRFSTGASWQAMATEYSKIVDGRANPAAVQAIVDKLIDGKKTVAEKEAAILDYLDREVRYTGIEFGEGAIVPRDPMDTLSKKYGDCKDKATLTVAMLRAAGIPSYVALLNAGSRVDVPADLPGMGLFDHAIVYVPAIPGSGKAKPAPDLWIDATDRYARLGQLPMADQGRLALIARPETTALTKIPESTSKENVLRQSREIDLGENGPANVTEKNMPTGVFESRYRGYYADKPDKDMRDGLTNYVKGQYFAEKLSTIDRTEPADLSRQFELTIACEKARRGFTDLADAQAAIRLEGLFYQLPDDLRKKEDLDEKKKQEQDKDHPKKPRSEDWELSEPFTVEWNYKIVPPAGFVPKDLPKDASIPVGPAVLTEQFSVDKSNAVLARVAFDSVKRRYTIAEATELRNKVADLMGGPAILINFEPAAEVLLHEGKVREALASYRSLIALHPNEAVHHLQVAKVLLEAGMGEAARAEARQAVKLEPNSALAEKILGQILQHDLVGRNLRAGSDLDAAVEAFRAAVKLDPDDRNTQGNLAILFEYDPVGRRYGPESHMKDAIAEYEKLGQDKLAELDLTNNLAFARFYAGDYAGALKAAQTLSSQPNALIAAAVAATQGSKAGLAEVNKRSTDENSFKDTARTAGEMLMNMRQYPLAADFLEAGAAGDNAAQTMGLAAMLRGAKHHEDLHAANTPADLVRQAMLLAFSPNVTEARLLALSSRNAQLEMKNEDAEEKKKSLEIGKQMNSELAREGSFLDVTVDTLYQSFDPKVEGDDANGYRVAVQMPNGVNATSFVVKEDGQYKLLDSADKPNAMAMEMVDRVNAGNLKGAKVLLDWLRADVHLEGGDDPLGGPIFPRFWTKGQAADARKMKLAAAAIMAGSLPTVAQGVAILEDGLNTSTTDREKTNIQLALAEGYANQQNFARQYKVSSELLKQVPESRSAFMNTVSSLIGLGRYDEALALADERLKLLDADPDALQAKMRIESGRGNYKAARQWAQKLADQGKDDAELMNTTAWFALYTDHIDDHDIAAAIKATQASKQNPHIMHTLACLYAEVGKTKEARDLLLRSMDELNLDEPNDDYWYAFGRIAEQYGERDIAIADYRKLEKPKQVLAIPTSSYRLAQMRLKAMGAETDRSGN